MTRDQLLKALKMIEENRMGDPEQDHIEADQALLAFVNDTEITAVSKAIPKWYS